jgi:xylan 1,4-beta-xylosidase
VESCFLDEKGVDDAKLLPSPDAVIGDVRRVREQISASKYPNLPLYFTEWSTSYTPRDLVHDSYISAPYILAKLQGTKGLVQGMSYWTYADLFEEPGPPSKPFEGGFGLLNPQGIRKSAYFTYKYLHALSGKVKANDAYTAYVEMGAPAKLTQAQLDQLASVTRDAPETNRVVTVGKAGAFNLTVPMRSNDVVLVTLEPLGKPKAPT